MRRMLMIGAAIAALMSSQPASADTVTDWWEVANRYYNAAQGSPGPLAPDTARATTRTALAMFEAVNAIDPRYSSYAGLPRGDPSASKDAAAASAAFRVLLHHYPANKAAIEESYTFAMDAIGDAKARETGKAIGEQAAQTVMALGGIDPAVAQLPYRPRTLPGEWIGASLPSQSIFTNLGAPNRLINRSRVVVSTGI